MSVDRPPTGRRGPHPIGRSPVSPAPRRVHSRPTGAPPGDFPRQVLRTAKVALLAGGAVAVALVLLPAPPASEEFQVAFADWRRGGAWYVDDGSSRPVAPGPAAPGGLGPSGPVMVADAAGPRPGGRLAAAPSNGTRVSDSAPAPLAGTPRVAAAGDDLPGLPPPGFADLPVEEMPISRSPGAAGGGFGPLAPPPSFVDTPTTEQEAERRSRQELIDAIRELKTEVRRLSERLNDAPPPAAVDYGDAGPGA